MTRVRPLALFGVFVVAACAEPTVPTPTLTREGGVAFLEGDQQYVLIANNSLPNDLAASVAAAGGQLTYSMDGIGAAVATSSNPGFLSAASGIPGLTLVAPDQAVEFTNPRTGEGFDIGEMSHSVGGHETFRAAQWNVDAISAPAAWNAGYRGAGVRVAVLDGGIHSAHIDLTGQIDVARSTSFTTGAFNTDAGTFWHGTHVAGIIAAKADNIGIVGIAPSATLIGVKVLHNGTGSFGGVISGIVYAATPIAEGGAGANVINMSLGGYAIKNGSANAHFVNLLNSATKYARSRGVTVVAAAGNDAIDLDHPKKSVGFPSNVLEIPGEVNGVIMVSATGPLGFAQGATNFDRPASYTNFGQSAITLAGPGGDFALPGNAVCVLPRNPTGSIVQFCWVLDMVMSTVRGTSNGSYNWAAGTSMASPAVAAVAALVIGKYGSISPSEVEAILRQSADDLGKPGNDDFYGRGRVNAARAVGAQ